MSFDSFVKEWTASVSAEVTSSGRLFQMRLPETSTDAESNNIMTKLTFSKKILALRLSKSYGIRIDRRKLERFS